MGAPLGGDAPLEIRTTHGPVRGSYNGSARAFLGIPYAAPPVGALRFRKPQPPAAWSAVMPATRWPSACIGETSESAHSHISTMDEDCLYLNVFTPRTMAADEKLPVLFWIHVSPTSRKVVGRGLGQGRGADHGAPEAHASKFACLMKVVLQRGGGWTT